MSVRKMCCVVAIVGLTGASVAGCSQVEEYTGFGKKTQIGAAGGAATGGLLAAAVGASPLGLAAGVILGGIAGGAVGNMLDNEDKEAALKAHQQSLASSPDGQTTSWTDPSDGHTGTYTPKNTYTTSDGLTCRDYEQTVTIDGRSETAIGTACKTADGSWRVHSAPAS